jgi:uncharacterized protein YceK
MQLENMVRVVLALIVALVLGGCGTIVNGTSQTIAVNTEPPGATLKIDDGSVWTTPTQVKLKRKNDYIFTISKEGYQTQIIPINSVLSGWLVGNIVFGGIIGGGIDAATGAAYTLTPEKVTISLTPLAPNQVDTPPPSGPMTTQQRLDLLERLHKEGVITDKEYEASKAKLQEDLKKEAAATKAPEVKSTNGS